MTIVVLVDTLRPGTGGTASVLELAACAAAIGHDVHVMVLRFDPQAARHRDRLRTAQFRLWSVPGMPLRWSTGGFWRDVMGHAWPPGVPAARRVARDLCDWGSHWRRSQFAAASAVIARAGVIIKAASMTGAQLAALRDLTSAPIVQNHAGSVDAYERFWLRASHRPPSADPADSLYVAFCRGFDRVLFQSPSQAAVCAARHPDLARRVAVVMPGCDEAAVAAAQAQVSPYAPGEFALVVVGTVQPRKRQALAVEVLAHVRAKGVDARLHLVGHSGVLPAYTAEVQMAARAANLTASVVWHGHRNDYLRYLVHASLLLVTSDAEGVPRVVREAMCAAVPIVSTPLDGLADFLGPPGYCSMVASEATEMAQAVAALAEDSHARRAIGVEAQRAFGRLCAKPLYRQHVSHFFSTLEAT